MIKSTLVLALFCACMVFGKGRDEDILNADVNELCEDRPENEYFRLTTESDCRDVVRCDKADSSGQIRLAAVKCPNG